MKKDLVNFQQIGTPQFKRAQEQKRLDRILAEESVARRSKFLTINIPVINVGYLVI